MSESERRFTPGLVEVRAATDEKRMIGGYAAKFMQPSQNLGGFKEQIAATAFNRSASQGFPDVQARYNHDDNMLLGTTGSGRLRVRTDNIGLTYEVDVPQARADVYELVQRGDVRQSSFAFISDEDEWDTDDTGYPRRTLHQVRLLDVAPVNAPAYLDTSVGLRSLADKFDASLEEVRKMADSNQLVRFFKVTTDTPASAKKRSAQSALAQVLTLDPNVKL